ncbi:endolytic transglycosylase MltG [Flavobacterium channae]|uniref:endolytic transglycosylase MltG n=1 Tax=Flavobacterium channae TaxID=2897181 RepID=UPI001E3CDB91|nr:endolytic transglycosylase MltG [Flavobacterium channae]UGS23015.1 endolytic transglycosylase MltG [Flavobacterium channae]
MNVKKLISIVAVAGIVIASILGTFVYFKAFTANTQFAQDEVFVYVPTDATYGQVKEILSPLVKDVDKFDFVATSRNYDTNVKSGKFLLKKNMTSFDIVRSLRLNVPVKVAFNNQETLGKLVQRLATQLEPDSLKLEVAFTNSPFLEENGLTEETALALFIPNTYEFYWNTPAEKIAQKLAKEYHVFWNNDRLAKAKEKGLTPIQVYTLASIVHKETAKVDERPTVAGVYLNRLQQDMPLQADPTVIFAIKKRSGDFDQEIKRVFYNDLRIQSPYNTYINKGLPPGPIAMPDVSAIDAVLNADNHDYIYFCANPDKPGYHVFASSYEAHQVNAKKYADWVSKLGINR